MDIVFVVVVVVDASSCLRVRDTGAAAASLQGFGLGAVSLTRDRAALFPHRSALLTAPPLVALALPKPFVPAYWM